MNNPYTFPNCRRHEAYICSFLNIADFTISEKWCEEEFQKGGLWPEPLLQFNRRSRCSAGSVASLSADGMLHSDMRSILRVSLYRHRVGSDPVGDRRQGFHRYLRNRIRQIPDLYRFDLPSFAFSSGRSGVTAVVVYPMNALSIRSSKSSIDIRKLRKHHGQAFRSHSANTPGRRDEDKRRRCANTRRRFCSPTT